MAKLMTTASRTYKEHWTINILEGEEHHMIAYHQGEHRDGYDAVITVDKMKMIIVHELNRLDDLLELGKFSSKVKLQVKKQINLL